jgi:hypothetical protein
MATTYKVLGQVIGAASNTNLYTVPAATEAIISTIVVCNQAASSKTFRIMVRPNNETLASKHYIAYDVSILANDSIALTLGITIDATDKLDIYSTDANVSFTAFGSEIA